MKFKKINAEFDNPTWVYLDSLSQYSLMSRDDEVRYSTIMQEAMHEMLDMAYRDPEIFSLFDRTLSELLGKTVKQRDVFHTAANTPDVTGAKKKVNISKIDNIIKSHKTLSALRSDLDKKVSDPNFVKHVKNFENQLINLCHKAGFSNRWSKNILKFYRDKLINSKDTQAIRRFVELENIYDSARKKLVEANVRLVVLIARNYLNNGMELIDLIQEGNKGLIRATEDFDHTKGCKFSTFALWWVKQSITRALNEKSRTIYLPTNLVTNISRIEHFKSEFYNKNLRYPSTTEIAKELDIPESKVIDIQIHTFDMLSMDVELSHDEDHQLCDLIPDTTVEDPLVALSDRDLKQNLKNILKILKPSERLAVIMRYGLDDDREKTLGEIASILNLTTEGVRQSILKGLKKLKVPSNNSCLLPWRDAN